MEKAVGSGRVLTAPVISEDGQPAAGSSIDEDVSDDETRDPSAEQEMSDLHVDEEVVKWKLTLHQIGMCLSFFGIYFFLKSVLSFDLAIGMKEWKVFCWYWFAFVIILFVGYSTHAF